MRKHVRRAPIRSRPAKIKYIGGWALNSTTVEKHYIDPTYPDTPAARYFFEYLVTGQRPAARVNMGQG